LKNEKLLKEFETYSLGEGRGKSTIKSYSSDVKQFLAWVGDIDLIGKTTLIDYADYLQGKVVGRDKKKKVDKTTKPATIQRKVVSVSLFVDFLNLEKGCNIKLAKTKIDTRLQAIDEFVSNKDVNRMIAVCEKEMEQGATQTKRNKALRDKCLIMAMLYTGARVFEVLQIKTADAKDRWIPINGKGGIHRDLYIPKKLSKIMKEYADAQNGKEFLFSVSDKAITTHTAWENVKDSASMARGIKLELVYPHALRHLYRQNLEAMGITETVRNQLMGHTLTVSERYGRLTKVDVYNKVAGMDIDKLIKGSGKK